MKIYLAARYTRQQEMLEYAKALRSLGHYVTSRWIDQVEAPYVTSAMIAEQGITLFIQYAKKDIEDLLYADVIIEFTSGDGDGVGRHIEFGIALATRKRIFLVGLRETIFHCLPQVE